MYLQKKQNKHLTSTIAHIRQKNSLC